MGKCEIRMRLGHVGFVFEEISGLPLETEEPEEVIWRKSVSRNTHNLQEWERYRTGTEPVAFPDMLSSSV